MKMKKSGGVELEKSELTKPQICKVAVRSYSAWWVMWLLVFTSRMHIKIYSSAYVLNFDCFLFKLSIVGLKIL